MIECLEIAIGICEPDYHKEVLIEHLKKTISRIDFDKLIILASQSTIEKALKDYLEYLDAYSDERMQRYYLFPGEDSDRESYLEKLYSVAFAMFENLPENHNIDFTFGYVGGFGIFKVFVFPLNEELDKDKYDPETKEFHRVI